MCEQLLDGDAALLHHRLANGRKRRIALAGLRQVVKTDNREIVGNIKTSLARLEQRAKRALLSHDEQRRRALRCLKQSESRCITGIGRISVDLVHRYLGFRESQRGECFFGKNLIDIGRI